MSDEIIDRIQASMQDEFRTYIYGVEELLEGICESPIEKMFGICLLVAADLSDGHRKDGRKLITLLRDGDEHPEKYSVLLIPQFRWKSYRIDFALKAYRSEPEYIFIECDGHDFHDRTKEQAQRDRSRDREIQSAGIPIFRFTGSEIYRNPAKCVNQAIWSAVGLLRHKK